MHCGFVSVTQQMLVQFVKGQFPVKRDADENKGVTLSTTLVFRDLACALLAFRAVKMQQSLCVHRSCSPSQARWARR